MSSTGASKSGFGPTVPTGSESTALSELLPKGARLGRYVVLERVGAGGMGVVYAAYDPELDRKVAVKLLHPQSEPRAEATGRTRALREAQAMARLSHPNVIAVHDVGTFEGRVFLAMEFIDGTTLKTWLRERTRTWPQILDVFADAGDGLAAAHAASLVHRDFKPDNVLIADDGRVLVTDFGLARPATGHTGSFMAVSEQPPSERPFNLQLTRTGAMVGTPAYMAPEQLAGERSDALSDQFSYCVALYEALYGERPFAGETIGELAANLADDPRPPRDVHVPRRVRRAVLQGLSHDPEDRHRTMEVLLAALAQAPRRPWRRWVAAGLPAAVVVGALLARDQEATPASYCAAVDHQLDRIWDEPVRQSLRTGFLATGEPFAEDVWQTVEQRLEAFATTWVQTQREVCQSQLHGERARAVIAVQMTCLGVRRNELAALTRVLARADSTGVGRALEATRTLRTPQTCADLDVLTRLAPPPPRYEIRDSVTALRERLAEATALGAAGRPADALEAVSAMRPEIDALGYGPLAAETLYELGGLQHQMGEAEAARETLLEAAYAATSVHHQEIAARAYIDLVWVVGHILGHIDRAGRIAKQAEAEIRALGGHAGFEASLLVNVGTVFYAAGRHDDALVAYRRALELREAHGEEVELRRAELDTNIGAVLLAQANYKEAERRFRAAVEVWVAAVGPNHPKVSNARQNLGAALRRQGHYAAALSEQRETTRIREATYGPNHPLVASAVNGVGLVLEDLGRYQEAYEHHRRSLRLLEHWYGPDHRVVAQDLVNLAGALRSLDRLDEAIAADRRALEILTADDPEALGLTPGLTSLALSEQYAGRHHSAMAHLERALAIRERILGPDHPDTAYTITLIGESMLELGRTDEALNLLEHANSHLPAEHSPTDIAATKYALARALAKAEKDPERARKLAREARNLYAELGESTEHVDAWIEARATRRAQQ